MKIMLMETVVMMIVVVKMETVFMIDGDRNNEGDHDSITVGDTR